MDVGGYFSFLAWAAFTLQSAQMQSLESVRRNWAQNMVRDGQHISWYRQCGIHHCKTQRLAWRSEAEFRRACQNVYLGDIYFHQWVKTLVISLDSLHGIAMSGYNCLLEALNLLFDWHCKAIIVMFPRQNNSEQLPELLKQTEFQYGSKILSLYQTKSHSCRRRRKWLTSWRIPRRKLQFIIVCTDE